MLERIRDISIFLEVDPFWMGVILVVLLLLVIVKCIYPWKPVTKSKKTKDKDGNEVVIYYRLDI